MPRRNTRSSNPQLPLSPRDPSPAPIPLADTHRSSPRTNAYLNLSVLRRHIPLATRILAIAPYAVLYTFQPATQTWEKSGVEGTLFVCALSSPPHGAPHHYHHHHHHQHHQQQQPHSSPGEHYAFLILNRRSLNNFRFDLNDPAALQRAGDYIILQQSRSPTGTDDDDAVYGLWVFAEPAPNSTAGMRDTVASVLAECAEKGQAAAREGGDAVQGGIEGSLGQQVSVEVSPVEQGLKSGSRTGSRDELGPGRDVLGELFRQAEIRYRGS